MKKKKDCYCSGMNHDDWSPTLCTNCKTKQLEIELKAMTIKPSNTQIIKRFFEDFEYDDYDFSENDGHINHETLLCLVCHTGNSSRGDGLKHFFKEHWNVK